MDLLHTLTHNFKKLGTLCIKHSAVLFLHHCHQSIQLGNTGIVETAACGHHRNQADSVERLICLFILGNIIKIDTQIGFVFHGGIEQRYLIFEETLHILHFVLQRVEVIFFLDDSVNECRVVPLLGEDILHRVNCGRNKPFVRVFMPFIAGQQFLIMPLLTGKSCHDMSNQPVLVLRHIHLIEIVPQELPDFTDFLNGYDLPLGDGGSADLAFFAEHIRELRVRWLNGCSAVFNGDLLVVDQLRDHCGNVDFPPPVGNGLITALHIRHRSR